MGVLVCEMKYHTFPFLNLQLFQKFFLYNNTLFSVRLKHVTKFGRRISKYLVEWRDMGSLFFLSTTVSLRLLFCCTCLSSARLVDWYRGYRATTPSHLGRKLAGPLCTAFSSARQPQRRSTSSDMRALR
jgi:hypothetical protein